MEVEELVREYLKTARMMQVATVSGDQPWNCTLYFASDDDLNIYWISTTETRHSKEITKNPKVAVAIPVRFEDLTVVGLQLEGDARLVEDADEIKRGVKLYSDKFNRGEEWYKDFTSGNNEHKLYVIKPRLFVIFDRVNFPDDSRKELRIN